MCGCLFALGAVTQGFIVISVARRKCFSINAAQQVDQCRLQSAIHHLRNYPDETVGFVFSPAESEKQQVAIIQVARGPWSFADNAKWHVVSKHDFAQTSFSTPLWAYLKRF